MVLLLLAHMEYKEHTQQLAVEEVGMVLEQEQEQAVEQVPEQVVELVLEQVVALDKEQAVVLGMEQAVELVVVLLREQAVGQELRLVEAQGRLQAEVLVEELQRVVELELQKVEALVEELL